METSVGVIYYEDNRNLREGISFLLQATSGLELLGAFADCLNLEEEIRTLKPDVVLMDIDLPGISGIEAVLQVKSWKPDAQVLMLTVFDDEEKIFEALRNGASGYLLKHTPPSEIIAAIFDIHQGGSPMTANIARKVLQYFQQQRVSRADVYNLSAREQDILKGLVAGYSYKLIADELFISIDTVRSHIRHIYDKLQVNSKTEAVLKAMKERLI
ncbi:response regulator [Siphonobacter aquaeclarae]|jgi:DNA-binding NarL/FixJ family response regulator|uniref:Two component transcriptional regulator, LuxR family n=1 Tax=Siphonobacter aquaeclarae TaxID=563176 RepID=A0A1G9IYU6_9BACT|nr:response regulator transcription factor [Siphonobacter aquaeclarae]MBO9637442.1 response regulator transcription factor [Siphonobacter aquaeclarae]SDL30123.1 two component transcriptional regulator, LuxR family [Siphonobacter aquaeclarae]